MNTHKDLPNIPVDEPAFDTIEIGTEVTLDDQVYVFGDGSTQVMHVWLEGWRDLKSMPSTIMVTVRRKGAPSGEATGYFSSLTLYQALLSQKN